MHDNNEFLFKDDDDDSDLNPNVFSPLNQYDIHTISHKSEYYWIGKKSVNNMRTSLWVADGKGLKVVYRWMAPFVFTYFVCCRSLQIYCFQIILGSIPSVMAVTKVNRLHLQHLPCYPIVPI
jgi:hypothetical protein